MLWIIINGARCQLTQVNLDKAAFYEFVVAVGLQFYTAKMKTWDKHLYHRVAMPVKGVQYAM